MILIDGKKASAELRAELKKEVDKDYGDKEAGAAQRQKANDNEDHTHSPPNSVLSQRRFRADCYRLAHSC